MTFQPHNYNPYTDRNAPPFPARPNGDRLALAAMILGILSAVTSVTLSIYPSLLSGSIAVVLALLSKGRAPRPAGKAKIGMICATVGMVFSGLVFVSTVKAVYENPELLEQAYDNFEKQYGVSYQELMESILNGGGLPTQ